MKERRHTDAFNGKFACASIDIMDISLIIGDRLLSQLNLITPMVVITPVCTLWWNVMQVHIITHYLLCIMHYAWFIKHSLLCIKYLAIQIMHNTFNIFTLYITHHALRLCIMNYALNIMNYTLCVTQYALCVTHYRILSCIIEHAYAYCIMLYILEEVSDRECCCQ